MKILTEIFQLSRQKNKNKTNKNKKKNCIIDRVWSLSYPHLHYIIMHISIVEIHECNLCSTRVIILLRKMNPCWDRNDFLHSRKSCINFFLINIDSMKVAIVLIIVALFIVFFSAIYFLIRRRNLSLKSPQKGSKFIDEDIELNELQTHHGLSLS